MLLLVKTPTLEKQLISRLVISLSILLSLTCPLICSAETYWVSPTGTAANLAACSGSTPLSGTDACAIDKARGVGVSAGDTIYFRAGTYNKSLVASCIDYDSFICPANSGTAEAKIIFSAYNSESVIFEGDAESGASEDPIWGAYLKGKDYIVIDGLTIYNVSNGIWISTGADYNEVINCTIYRNTLTPISVVTAMRGIHITNSNHNWIHSNTIHGFGCVPPATVEEADAGVGECSELILIGSPEPQTAKNNTVENNTLYHAGHALANDYNGSYDVWRNNIGHNEGWKNNLFIFGTSATDGNSSMMEDTSKDFVALGVQVGWHIFANNNKANFVRTGSITAVSTTKINYDNQSGYFLTPTFSEGIGYSIGPSNYSPDPTGNNPGNGKFAHRGFSFENDNDSISARYHLFEGNRSCHASNNPNNRGADGLTLGSPGNIIRYNAILGSDGPGINLKSYGTENKSGSNNSIYSNTVYKNGRTVVGNGHAEPSCTAFFDSSATGNYIKNNLLFQNGNSVCANIGDYYGGTKSNHTWANNLCDATDSGTGCTAIVDPVFIDTTMTDLTSSTLPNLGLQSTSTARDGAGSLTLSDGAGDNNATLHVDNAFYFQDGTWGSSLSNIQADWIAIGTVTNTVQISSIDYATNTVTLASPMTWADDAPIWLYKKSDGTRVLYGSAPDYGAYEYPSADPVVGPTQYRGGLY